MPPNFVDLKKCWEVGYAEIFYRLEKCWGGGGYANKFYGLEKCWGGVMPQAHSTISNSKGFNKQLLVTYPC